MHIRHITLTTGHARDSFAGEVAPNVTEAMQGLISRICAGEVSEPVSLQEYALVGPYSISGRCSSRCLTATVYADGPPSELICTIGIATHSRCGATLWRALHTYGQIPVATDPDECPPEPWVAAALDEGALTHPDALEWLGDFERCLAWGWVRRQSQGV